MTPIPGEILCGIGDIVERYYHNLKNPKPRDVSYEIYEYICPYLVNPRPDLSNGNNPTDRRMK